MFLAKEKIFDDTMIELNIEPKTEWNLFKPPLHASTVNPPLKPGNPLLDLYVNFPVTNMTNNSEKSSFESIDEHWLSQVMHTFISWYINFFCYIFWMNF